MECESDHQLDAYFQQDATPDDAAERTKLLDNTKQFNAACEKNSKKVLPQVRTTDAARDMDLMRQVLGDDKLHYFGISYGTELGGVYAHLFPKHVGRAVFDAVVDPTQNSEQGSLGQAKGFQLALDNFAEDCTSKTDGLPGRRHRPGRQGPYRQTAQGPRQQADPRHLPPPADPDRRHQRHRAGAVLEGLLGVPHRGPRSRPTTVTARS